MESELEETCGLIATRVRLFPGLAPIRTCSEVAEQPQETLRTITTSSNAKC